MDFVYVPYLGVITVVDGFKYIGTMQICVARMLQESTIFFVVSRLFKLRIISIGAESNPSCYPCYLSGSTKGCMRWMQQMGSQTKDLKSFIRCFKHSYNPLILWQHKGNQFRRKFRPSNSFINHLV